MVTVVVLAGLSACTATSTPTTGVLTGTASACSGVAFKLTPTARLTVYKGTAVVATQQVPNGSTYRFVLPPGQYYITNTGNPVQASDREVTVVAGRTTRKDVPNLCH